jgi:hypothetical protein
MSTARDIADFLLSLAAPHLHGVLVLFNGNKFISGFFVTGDNCLPVSLSPVVLSPAIVHRCDKFIAGINDTRDH